MIPLQRYPEPRYFDKEIRQKGQNWLKSKGIHLNAVVPEGFKFDKKHSFWTKCKNDLEKLYKQYCAYTCCHIHTETTEYSTVDHIKPKSRVEAYLAYEWKNYCLCCARINTKKEDNLNIIDPFEVTNNLFYLRLGTGKIYVNSSYPDSSLKKIAETTIDELDLNNGHWKEARRLVFKEFGDARKAGASLEYAEERLKKENIFVWSEAKRLGKLM